MTNPDAGVGSFGIYAYAINVALSSGAGGNSRINIDLTGGNLNGDYVIGYACDVAEPTCSGGNINETPFTNAGFVTVARPRLRPPPSQPRSYCWVPRSRHWPDPAPPQVGLIVTAPKRARPWAPPFFLARGASARVALTLPLREGPCGRASRQAHGHCRHRRSGTTIPSANWQIIWHTDEASVHAHAKSASHWYG
jgi:hypothetical protein